MHPICIRMHPYASKHHIYTPNGNIQDTFSPEKSTSQQIYEFDFSIMRSGAQNRPEANPLNPNQSCSEMLISHVCFFVFGYLLAISWGSARRGLQGSGEANRRAPRAAPLFARCMRSPEITKMYNTRSKKGRTYVMEMYTKLTKCIKHVQKCFKHVRKCISNVPNMC